MNIVVFHQMWCKTRLAKVYLDNVRGNHPLKVGAQEPFNSAQEIHLNMILKKFLKHSFNFWVFQEVYEVINIEAKSEMVMGRGSIGVGRIDDITTKKARIVWIFLKAELD